MKRPTENDVDIASPDPRGYSFLDECLVDFAEVVRRQFNATTVEVPLNHGVVVVYLFASIAGTGNNLVPNPIGQDGQVSGEDQGLGALGKKLLNGNSALVDRHLRAKDGGT